MCIVLCCMRILEFLWDGVVLGANGLMSVKYLVCTHDLRRLVSWWVVALCLVFLRPLRNLL